MQPDEQIHTDKRTRVDELPDAIPLVPYQVTNFLVQEKLLSDLVAQTRGVIHSDQDTGRFPRNSLAEAWYREHPNDIDDGNDTDDKSSGKFPRQRNSTRMRFSTRIPSEPAPSSSKPLTLKASSSKVTLRTEATRSSFIPTPHWTRERLQEQWDKATKGAGAATVTIVNEVDGEEVPDVPEDFQYLEHGYDWGEYASDPNFLVGCECVGNCGTGDVENCCIRPIDSDPEGLTGFWYDKQGLFRFDDTQMLLRECNVNCSCDGTCQTRVAQKPRQIPLEVFKTAHCGWGVRPAVGVPKGSLLGLYSGVLLKRWKTDRICRDRKSYVFDLDHKGYSEEGQGQGKYSVDGYTKGNWGRFVNHSCDPNMQVLPGMFDTPEIEKSYLVFVAIEDIPERVELTVDYHPNQAAPSKGKGKRKRGGLGGCMCGADSCRGTRP